MELKSTEFFRNIKKLPPPDTDEFKQLIDWEIEKIKGGVTVNGVFFSGWLYWHINHWWIRVDDIDEWGNDVRKPSLPDLRDNEWLRAEWLEKCRIEKKGYIEVGGRQGGKSEMEASYFGMNAIMYSNTQNLMVCGNDNDLSLLKDKVDFGLKNLWEGINIPRLDKTWRLNQIRLGYKKPNGDDEVWSYIIIRNANDGQNTEAAAGTTIKTYITDEIGKFPFAASFKAAEPAIRGRNGWRTVPILVGTGGSFEKGKDAENFFYNPDANNFLAVEHEGKKIKTGMFLSGLYRQDCKEIVKLDDWLREEKQIEIAKKNELSNFTIWASNKKKAKETIEKELLAAKHNPDKALYLKQKMYYPIDVEDCFLRSTFNLFNTEAAKRQKQRLEQNITLGTPVFLTHDGEKIVHEFTDKQPISNYPIRSTDDKDAPIVIYEFPIENPPYGLYVAGVDPYRQGQAMYSDSLGAVYIYKRMHDIFGDKYQDMFVASYCARPEKKEKWEEQARLLIKFYNARTLCENDDISFIEFMKSKGDAHYLEKQPDWLREIVPNTTVSREYGVHRSAQKIIDYLHTTLKKYTEEVIISEKDETGSVVREVTGIVRILDPMLLEEMIQHDEENNFDRIVACFTKDNIVCTKNGFINIQDVKIGDEVLTHVGNFKKVVTLSKIKKNIGDSLIKIKPLGFEKEITCTEEHPFLISSVTKGTGKAYFKNFKISELKWKRANELTLSDYLLIPKRKYLQEVEIDKKLLYLLGWYLADGHRSKNTVRLTFQIYQKHIAEHISEIIQSFDDFDRVYVKHFNYLSKKIITTYRDRKPPRIYKISNKEAYNLEFNSTIFNKIIDENVMILKGGEKQLKKQLFNSKNLLPLVLGFLEGDGHQKSTFIKGSKNSRDTIEVSGTYHILIKQIRQILFDNDIWATTSFHKQKNKNSKIQLRLDIQDRCGINKIISSIDGNSKKFKFISNRKQRKNHIVIDEGVLIPIKKLTNYTLEENSYVYNMEVEDDNSYTISNVAVHNCELAVAQAVKMDPIYGKVKQEDDPKIKALYKGRETRILFPSSRGMFTKRKHKIFT